MSRPTIMFLLSLTLVASTTGACSGGQANLSLLGTTTSTNFAAHLSSTPTGAETPATGEATFVVSTDGKRIQYRLVVDNVDNVTMAHIHQGQAGQEGPILVWLYPPSGPPPKEIPGTYSGVLAESTFTESDLVGPLQGQPLSALVEAMQKGDTYVNVHTVQYPAGAIAGQIEAVSGQM